MKLDTAFNDIKGVFNLCLRCRECTYGDWPENYQLCPIHRYHRVFTASAGGLISLMAAVVQGKIDYHPTMAEFAYQCTTCGTCDVCEVMPIRAPHTGPTELIRFMRYQLVKRDLVPDRGIKEILKLVREKGDFPGEKVTAPQKDGNKQNTTLFAECLHSKDQLPLYQTTLKLLNKMGKSVGVFNHGGCSGSCLYDLGFWDELSTLMAKRSQDIEALAGRDVVFTNPHSQEFMVKRYPQISSGHREIAASHISELLADALEDGKLKVKNKKSIKVSYHDPCYLGRELGIYDAPRKVLSLLDGVELTEMKRNRRNAYCCGAGGGGRGKAFPEFSMWITTDRL